MQKAISRKQQVNSGLVKHALLNSVAVQEFKQFLTIKSPTVRFAQEQSKGEFTVDPSLFIGKSVTMPSMEIALFRGAYGFQGGLPK
jgi:hypothetical protein